MSENLTRYLDLWQLSDPELLATTPSSFIYTVAYEEQRVILKLLTPQGIEERSGSAALRYFDGHGAVRLLREDDDAHLMEYADGEDVTRLVREGHDDQATEILGEVLNKLHSAPKQPFPAALLTLPRWFRALFDQAKRDQHNGNVSMYTRAAKIAEDVFSQGRDVCVLHGDMHHENVRMSARGWLTFDPKGLVGDRAFDCANILRNPHTLPDLVHNEARLLRTVDVLARTMNLDAGRIITFTYLLACLSASWYVEDGNEADATSDITIAGLTEPHLPKAVF